MNTATGDDLRERDLNGSETHDTAKSGGIGRDRAARSARASWAPMAVPNSALSEGGGHALLAERRCGRQPLGVEARRVLLEEVGERALVAHARVDEPLQQVR